MNSSFNNIAPDKIPAHIAVIMDGNGRWAKKKGAARIFGHQNAIKAVRETTEVCAEIGVKYLTLYAFSTENWSRPKREVDALMQLLVSTLRGEVKTLMDNNIRLSTIGCTTDLPKKCQKELQEIMDLTVENNGMNLILALSYGAREEILKAVRSIVKDVEDKQISSDSIDEQCFDEHLYTKGIPHPELVIRTSGEYRISNFLLWQLAYAELYFTEVLWPDFRKENLLEAIRDYQQRERRFGKTSEQIIK